MKVYFIESYNYLPFNSALYLHVSKLKYELSRVDDSKKHIKLFKRMSTFNLKPALSLKKNQKKKRNQRNKMTQL